MSCLGVHFALTEAEAENLRSLPDDPARLFQLQEGIEETYFEKHREWIAQCDKAWDALHRALTDGQLGWDNGEYPLSHVVLGGEQLYHDEDYIMSLKTPEQVGEIAAAMAAVTEAEFRRRYFAIDATGYGHPLTEQDFAYTWETFQTVRDLYNRAAQAGRFVLFTADQ